MKLKSLNQLPIPEPTGKELLRMRHAAEIVAVKPSEVVRGTGLNSHKFFEHGNYCTVRRLYDQQTFTIHNGQINQVPERLRKVGQTGFLAWVKSSSCHLPCFTDQVR